MCGGRLACPRPARTIRAHGRRDRRHELHRLARSVGELPDAEGIRQLLHDPTPCPVGSVAGGTRTVGRPGQRDRLRPVVQIAAMATSSALRIPNRIVARPVVAGHPYPITCMVFGGVAAVLNRSFPRGCSLIGRGKWSSGLPSRFYLLRPSPALELPGALDSILGSPRFPS